MTFCPGNHITVHFQTHNRNISLLVISHPGDGILPPHCDSRLRILADWSGSICRSSSQTKMRTSWGARDGTELRAMCVDRNFFLMAEINLVQNALNCFLTCSYACFLFHVCLLTLRHTWVWWNLLGYVVGRRCSISPTQPFKYYF